MSINIEISTEQVATSTGKKIYYSFDVVEEGPPHKILESRSTTNSEKAQKYLESVKQKYSTSKVNGVQDKDPFSDGTVPQQFNYQSAIGQPEAVSPSPSGVGYGSFSSEKGEIPEVGSPRQPTPVLNTSRLVKKARDLSGCAEEKKRSYESLTELERSERKINGVFGTRRVQAMARRDNTPCEDVLRGNDNNAFIVIGNDRVSKSHSGYGGKGHTQCDSIDLCAGLGGFNPKEVEKIQAESGTTIERPIKQNPNFFIDSARIYISQKTDVDKNFGIGEFGKTQDGNRDNKDDKNIGKYGAKSAVAVKADNIRLIGRESIRIVTGTDKFNSQGGEVLGKSGVELVAMNDITTLQPLVLGDNLQAALSIIIDNVQALAQLTHAYIKYQMKYNQAVSRHTHSSPFFARPTLPSETVIAGNIQCDIETASKTELSILKHITNLQGIKHNFLTESGESFINSRLNKAN